MPNPEDSGRVFQNIRLFVDRVHKEPDQGFLFHRPVLEGLRTRSEMLGRARPYSKDPETDRQIRAAIGLFDVKDTVEFERTFNHPQAHKVPDYRKSGKGRVLGYLVRSDEPLSLLVLVGKNFAVLPINPKDYPGTGRNYPNRRLIVNPQEKKIEIFLTPTYRKLWIKACPPDQK